MSDPPPAGTAQLVVIGNELLSGKIQDANTPFLAGELRRLGTRLTRVTVIPDCVETIAAEVRRAAADAAAVFTSGGVGPTHDDVTMEGVARAFGQPLVRHAGFEARIRERYGERLTDAALTMADIPRDAALIEGGDLWVPVVSVANVYIFPGIPDLFRRKFAVVRERFRCAPIFLASLYLARDEQQVAPLLEEVLASHEGLEIGSYPRYDGAPYTVRLTLESTDREQVVSARAALRERLEGHIVSEDELE